MEQKYLIDTNIVIDFCENKLQPKDKSFVTFVIDNDPTISVINKIELLSFSVIGNEILIFTETATVLGLTEDVINKTIAIPKTHRMKLPDAIIAATALVHELTLITRNITDFKNISRLKIINPWND